MIDDWLQRGGDEWAGVELETVRLDAGVFKYVLARVSDGERSKLVAWGDAAAAYHNDVFQQLRHRAKSLGLTTEVLGGGRIEHHPEQRSCHVYGYSVAFGPAPHEVTAALVRRANPRYPPSAVTVAYEGY
uniref:Janus a n=1 Tax=Tetraselmis sp. GSL018 TaxID=582737 RepID=A0A061S347_9CHLO